MNVLFAADLHLGHRAILRYRPGPYATVREYDEWAIGRMLAHGPTKRTLWYLMGDVAMEEASLALVGRLPGRKVLVRGNHDALPLAAYARWFEDVAGGFCRYGMWVTHIPVHPEELRGRPNLHGHSHAGLRPDPRYLNAALEHLPGNEPMSLDRVRAEFLARGIPLR